ncbi:MAG: ribonuclease protein component [Bacteroidota bacterium]|jgi:ribonuclease P protein component
MANDQKFGFSKSERLCSKRNLELLLAQGESINLSGIKVIYRLMAQAKPGFMQLAISVPKRNFKKAVDRNRTKRLIREVFRKEKQSINHLLQLKEQSLHLLIIYYYKQLPDLKLLVSQLTKAFAAIEKSIK